MSYFRELPDLAYQSPLSHKNSSRDYIIIKNIFRRTKLADYLKDAVTIFQKFVIGDGDRPDTIAAKIYGDSRLDYVVILMAGITNIHHQWPLQDYQVYEHTLTKYGSETEMNAIHHYETFEIKDDKGRLILPSNLIVDKDFKIDGTASKFPSTTKYALISDAGNTQLDDKDEFTVLTDNIAFPVTNFQYEITENEKRREIDVLKPSFVGTFVNDLRDVVRYSKSSSYINSTLASTENTNVVNP